MARRKQRSNKAEDEAPRNSRKLPEAWASCPSRPPKYALYCDNYENDRQFIVNSFSCYAIRRIYDTLVGDNEVTRSPKDPNTVTFGDIDIRSDELADILAHEDSPAEAEWTLPTPYPEQIERFLNGGRMSRALEERDESGKIIKVVKEKKAAEPKTPKIDRSQFITVQSIAEDLDLDPRDARAALRKAKVEKPQGGWLGDETWAKGIRDILKKAKVELKGKKK